MVFLATAAGPVTVTLPQLGSGSQKRGIEFTFFRTSDLNTAAVACNGIDLIYQYASSSAGGTQLAIVAAGNATGAWLRIFSGSDGTLGWYAQSEAGIWVLT
jgi:hypothetical protein